MSNVIRCKKLKIGVAFKVGGGVCLCPDVEHCALYERTNVCAPRAELYEYYCGGWKACLAGVDGRYWFTQPGECAFNTDLRKAWTLGFSDCMEREEGEEPIPLADWPDIETDICG